MEIQVQTHGFVDVVEIRGRPDVRNVRQILDAVGRLIEKGEPFLVADLSHVPDLDSSWLGALVTCRERTRRHGGTIKIVARGRCLDLFVASCLDRVFEVYRDQDEALDSFDPECATVGVP